MKRILSIALTAVMVLTAFAGCSTAAPSSTAPASTAPSASAPASAAPASEAPAAEAWTPSTNINWVCTSSPGGGSDIYTRVISDIMTLEGYVTQTFLVDNQTDGGGEVGRLQVSQVKAGKDADHTLLTFNSGDLMPMVKNTKNRVENFTPIAIMAVDKQILLKGEQTTYAGFKEAIEAAKSGTTVILGGSKGDDIATYELLLAELGMTEEQMPYITYDSTGDAITAALGGHIEFVIAKPAAASQYVEAGSLIPALALSTARFEGMLKDAPTLSELGDYKDVEKPVWRGVVGPKNMSPEAAKFWSDTLKQVSETDKWASDYIDKNLLIPDYQDHEAAAKFMADYQAEYMAEQGIQ